MLSILLPLAWSLEFHDPKHPPIELDRHWGGILFIVIGVLLIIGPATTSKSIDLTSWLTLNYDERPATRWERFLGVVVCFGVGFYLVTHP